MPGAQERHFIGNTAGVSPTPASKWEAHPSHFTRQGSSPPEDPCLPYRTANRARHLVHDALVAPRGGMRTYAHFAWRSPLPARADGKTLAVRNSPPLVNATIDQPGGVPFHSDAAFNFMNPAIPTLATRTADDLPATEQHPTASERFRAVPAVGATLTDLGLRNVFANPDMPEPQDKSRNILCDDDQPRSDSQRKPLDQAIARFKTPGLRDLGHSEPFMHNGQRRRAACRIPQLIERGLPIGGDQLSGGNYAAHRILRLTR